jgi:hypothetical protein
MFMVVPQFVVKFSPEVGSTWNWIVSGEDDLDVFCKILRWNGIKAYSVTPKSPEQTP